MQILPNVIFDLLVRVSLSENGRDTNIVLLLVKRYLTAEIQYGHVDSSYQQVASLGERDELLVSGGTHVEADRQHLLQSCDNQRGLDGVELPTPFLVSPLLILPPRLTE